MGVNNTINLDTNSPTPGRPPAAETCAAGISGGTPHKSSWDAADDALVRRWRSARRTAVAELLAALQVRHSDWTPAEVAAQVERRERLPVKRRQAWNRGSDLILLSMAQQPLERITGRLDRSASAILARLRRLGHSADFLGGFKTKDLEQYLQVTAATVRRWQRRGWLRRRRARITEASLKSLCREHPEEIPFSLLPEDTRFWLVTVLGYPAPREQPKPAPPSRK